MAKKSAAKKRLTQVAYQTRGGYDASVTWDSKEKLFYFQQQMDTCILQARCSHPVALVTAFPPLMADHTRVLAELSEISGAVR